MALNGQKVYLSLHMEYTPSTELCARVSPTCSKSNKDKMACNECLHLLPFFLWIPTVSWYPYLEQGMHPNSKKGPLQKLRAEMAKYLFQKGTWYNIYSNSDRQAGKKNCWPKEEATECHIWSGSTLFVIHQAILDTSKDYQLNGLVFKF